MKPSSRKPMLRYAAKYLASPLLNVTTIILLVFLLMNALPSDPARVRLGVRYNKEDAQALRERYGLDKPLAHQFVIYLGELVQGNFGTSIRTGEQIKDGLAERVPRSATLVFLSLAIASIAVVPAVYGAFRPSRSFELLEGGLLNLSVVPSFVTGALAIFAATTFLGVSLIASGPDSLTHYLVPAVLLSAYPAFALYKVTRDTMQETLDQPYIQTYRAFGFSWARVMRVALRICGPSILGIATNLVAYYLSSIFIIEFLFSLGGIGAWGVNSAQNYDTPVVLATVVVSALIYNATNVFTSLLAPVLDPRVLDR